jgi:methylmalonyl-CoA/ethylmalonyl-CoA epimerase
LTRLIEADIRLINSTPTSGAHGSRIAFVHPKSTGGVLVELLER